MKVLTYIKDLPVKLTNDNKSVISLEGATLYLDEEANRYAYICFLNKYRKPFFALILNLTQYDVGGHLIKKEKYYVPNCFGNRGRTVLEKPINIDKECEGMEIEIALAIFSNKVFANNVLRSRNSVHFEFPSLINNDPLTPRGNAANFNFPGEIKEEPAPATSEIVEEPEVEEEVKEEAPVVEEKVAEAPVEAAPAPEAPAPEAPEAEEAIEAKEEAHLPKTQEGGKFVDPLPKKKSPIFRIVFPVVVGVICVAIFLIIMLVIKGNVPPNPVRK